MVQHVGTATVVLVTIGAALVYLAMFSLLKGGRARSWPSKYSVRSRYWRCITSSKPSSRAGTRPAWSLTLMLPLAGHSHENAARHVDTLLTLSPTRLWVRDLGMRLLPQAWLGRAFGKQFDAERALVKEILGAAA